MRTFYVPAKNYTNCNSKSNYSDAAAAAAAATAVLIQLFHNCENFDLYEK
jgi:hypothetical protein